MSDHKPGRFHGPQPGSKIDRGSFGTNGPKGVMRQHKQILREEAEARNAKTLPENRRQARLAREATDDSA